MKFKNFSLLLLMFNLHLQERLKLKPEQELKLEVFVCVCSLCVCVYMCVSETTHPDATCFLRTVGVLSVGCVRLWDVPPQGSRGVVPPPPGGGTGTLVRRVIVPAELFSGVAVGS